MKVYYHSGCPDGILSRELLKLDPRFSNATFIPFTYTELPDIHKAIFVDCSPVTSQRKAFLDVGSTILEHHAGFEEWYNQQSESDRSNWDVILGDTTKGESGAYLAYQYIGGSQESWIQELVHHVAASDCFLRNEFFARGREIAYMISQLGDNWSLKSYNDNIVDLFANNRNARIDKQISEMQIIDNTAFINSVQMSDAADRLITQGVVSNVVGYHISDGTIIYSLRGVGSKAIAVANGGGGHELAAGFKVRDNNIHPVMLYIEFLRDYK